MTIIYIYRAPCVKYVATDVYINIFHVIGSTITRHKRIENRREVAKFTDIVHCVIK